MKTILVTGGLGYIGSHTVVALQQSGYDVVIIDNLANSTIETLEGITQITNKAPAFERIDVRNKAQLSQFFDTYPSIDGVIHFAASKAVGESVEQPLLYYENNVTSLIYLLQECRSRAISNFIFSSSCTVYGEPDTLPINEEAPIKKAVSPYGNTKQICEEIISDLCDVSHFNAISLRYFNPIGAHDSAHIGELPVGIPQNLVPYITQTAAGIREELSVFGADYPTPDGSCIRDYIHVVDLAAAHVKAIERLIRAENAAKFRVFNIGTGRGNSVFEMISTFEEVTGLQLNYKVVDRRPGDVVAVYADTTKANEELGWTAKYDIKAALQSAWQWEKKVRNLG